MNKVNSRLFLTCEHGGARVPAKYKKFFKAVKTTLATHRGLDIGALAVAKNLKKYLNTSLVYSDTTRLLVDLNRLPDSPTLISEFVINLDLYEKNKMLKDFYFPHRNAVTTEIKKAIAAKNVAIHVGVHSFTQKLNGKTRRMQLALLYDSKHVLEKQFCDAWIKELRKIFPEYIIARNDPYRGDVAGINQDYRKKFKDKYIGVEFEMNQALLIKLKKAGKTIQFSKDIAKTLSKAVKSF